MIDAASIGEKPDTGFDSQSSDVTDRFCRRSDCAKSPSFDKLNVDASRKRDNSVDVLANGIVTRLYTQPLDHTNNAKGFFLQRYYVNDTFYKPGGPIFLHTQGESAIRADTVANSGVSELAASLNGLLISLEHRYYGKSYPLYFRWNSSAMKYLTTDQALADFANFIKNPPLLYQIPKNAKWIFVGGSYAGNLAAWMRQKYPDLVTAAYASSAPLKAKLDFFEFDQVIAKRLPCSSNLADAIKYIDSILFSGNRTEIDNLKDLFGMSVLSNDGDFASALTTLPSDIVQSYMPPSDPGQFDEIPTFCSVFDNSTDKSPKAMAIAFAQATRISMQVKGLSTDSAVANRWDTKDYYRTDSLNDDLAWLWQYCNEYGYFQNAPQPPSVTLRSLFVNSTYYQFQCNFAWPDIPPPRVDATNAKYGGNDVFIANTVFTVGEFDPWRPLSIAATNRASSADMVILEVKGGSHTNDLKVGQKSDSESLLSVRKAVKDTIAGWLGKTCRNVNGLYKCE
ncbi:2712_t:CDS:2 [Paraglomus brasilianum]|uniref:2712_t:CDS:1 n=1 Tax=Paraglomus brasilianum TaxID=144538 RepID=A0A9N9AMR0_9GLOM|nr:2712_t:CDS:2 [Paraglomus brasilianum]